MEPEEPSSRQRKPPSEWKKTPRLAAIKDKEPDFITKTELAHHLGSARYTRSGSDGTTRSSFGRVAGLARRFRIDHRR